MPQSGFRYKVTSMVSIIDNFTEVIGKIISWLTLLMVLLTFFIVVMRYGFNMGSIALQESVLYFHGLVFMLGAAYTLKGGGHVRVDIFYHKFSKRKQALVNVLGSVLLLLPVCLFIFFISFDYVSAAWRILEKSPEAGGLPFVYLNKSYLLILAMTLLIQGIAEIGRNLLVLMDNGPEKEQQPNAEIK
jgi:TRAP-type mannitol/chloroaromatic compound transport system permease small subunit